MSRPSMHRILPRGLALVVVMTVLGGIAGASFSAAAAGASLKASAPVIAPNGTETLTGAGFSKSETVTIDLDATQVGIVKASATGAFTVKEKVPLATTPGAHAFHATGQTSKRTANVSFTVRANWAQYGYGATHTQDNGLETVLSPATVPSLHSPWVKTTTASNDGSSPTEANGDVFQVCTRALCAYNQSGVLVWRSPQAQDLGTPASGDGVVIQTEGYCYTSGGNCQYIHAYNPTTGKQIWSKLIPASDEQTPLLVGATLYLATDTTFYAIQATTGKVLWSLSGSFWTAPTYVAGYLVMGSSKGLEAVSPTTHKLLWNVTTPNAVGYPPIISGSVIYTDGTAPGDYGTAAYHLTNGSVIWSNTLLVSGPIALAGSTLLVPTDGGLVADSASTGQALWTAPISAQVTGSPVVANGVVYYATGQTMIAANLTDGSTLWSDATLPSPVQGTPIVVNGRLFAATADGALHAWVS